MPAPKTFKNRFFDTLLTFKQYLRFLTGQGITLPSYGTLIQWSNFFNYAQGLAPRNLAAYYANDPSSIMLDSSGNVALWADSSGNSAVNALCLNGASGNFGSSPNASAIQITGDIDLRVYVRLPDWTPALNSTFLAKEGVAGTRSYRFRIIPTGAFEINLSSNGTALSSNSSTAATGFVDGTAHWARVTWRQSDGRVQFFTSEDGVNWTQLGNSVNTVIPSIFNSSSQLEIGSIIGGTTDRLTGNVFRAQVYSGIPVSEGGSGGTLAFDADFSKVAKLSSVFTEQSVNAAAVTINATGDTGARIAGERDLYQGTATNRPVYTAAINGNRFFMTFDGSSDYLKAPSFPLVQPETVYFIGSQVTWTAVDKFFDGNSGAERMSLGQISGSPGFAAFAGGTDTALNTNLPLGVRGIITTQFNGNNSYTQVNRTPQLFGNAGSSNGNGFTLCATTSGANQGNFTVSEVAIYSEAHSNNIVNIILAYFANKYSISL